MVIKHDMMKKAIARATLNGSKVTRGATGRLIFSTAGSRERGRKRHITTRAMRRLLKRSRPLRKMLGLNRTQLKVKKAVFRLLLPAFLVVLVGVAVGSVVEGWTVADSFYVTCVSVATIGYGDLAPQSQLGRMLFALYIPMGACTLIWTAGRIVEFRVRNKTLAIKSVAQLLEMDKDGDGQVCLEEFQLFMLKEMGKVDDGMLQILEDQFHKLDVSGDGMLSADDVIDKSTEDISITKVLI